MNAQTNIQNIMEIAKDIDRVRLDYSATTDQLIADDTGQVGLDVGGAYETVTGAFDADGPAKMYLTTHALGQIAGRLGIKYGKAFFKNNPDLPQHIIGDVLNHYLDYRDPKQLLLRQFNGEIRGVCGSTYLIMDHSWMLEQALHFLTDPDSKEVAPHIIAPGWRVEPDYMNVKLILRNEYPDGGSDGNYGTGVALRNGTVANASCGVEALTMRGQCTNSIRWRNSKWTIRHVGSTDILATREVLIITGLVEAFEKSYDIADRLIRARKQRLPNVFEVIGKIVDGQKLAQDLEPIIAAGTEKRSDLAALVNGLTWAAQPQNHGGIISDDTAEDLEAFAGNLLEQHADGLTHGDALARALFSVSADAAHVLSVRDE